MGICYKPPSQEDGVDEIFYRQSGAHLQTLLLVGDFSHRDNMAGREESPKFLESANDNFLTQVTEEPTKCHAGLSAHQQGAADGECSAPRQPWLQ